MSIGGRRRIYLVAGEISGDAHGSELMEQLRARDQAFDFSGLGGDRMEPLAKSPFRNWTEKAAVVGLADVLKQYPYFRKMFHQSLDEIDRFRPEAVILIDYPGFNLRLARQIKKRHPAQRIIYFISPQVWAWNRGRIPKMAQVLDLMLCIFPFEKPLYEKSGLRTEFVGHPLIDALEKKRKPGATRDPNLIGLFPGSRTREVDRIAPVMLQAAALLKEWRPDLRFAIASARDAHVSLLRKLIDGSELDPKHIELLPNQAYDLMQTASVGMMASGTATLEASFFGMPYVIVYKVAPLTWEAGKRLVKVPHLGIANIIAGREIIPEFLQNQARPADIGEKIIEILENKDGAHSAMVKNLEKVIDALGREEGAIQRAADIIMAELDSTPR